MGDGNYTSPTSRDLAKDFGLQPLIGRSLATISDMRMGKGDNVSAFVENLLRVSGEDEVSVNRKYKAPWEGRLGTRFLILSNEAPQFKDTSGAIISRLILIRSWVSFIGKEDLGLAHDLRAELPGILNWALEGLARLRARGYFVQPSSARAELSKMVELTSPVKAFSEARLRQNPEATVRKDEIWYAFGDWLEEMGHVYTGGKGYFFKDLGTVGHTFEDVTLRDLTPQERSTVVTRATSGLRAEMKRNSAEDRKKALQALDAVHTGLRAALVHYQSPAQMLAREGLGSERRSRVMQQIVDSGPAELSSLASYAAATGDKELAAALNSRVSAMPRNDRPFSPHDLAEALVGNDWREVQRSAMEAERLLLDAMTADNEFESGLRNTERAVRLAMMARAEQALTAPTPTEET